jgi:hypothetical protein
MSCSCNCNCGCNSSCGCFETACPSCVTNKCTTSTTTTTTANPNCEPCEEFYDCECIEYDGPNNDCFNLKDGDTLCKILENVIENLPQCKSSSPLSCNFTAVVTIK